MTRRRRLTYLPLRRRIDIPSMILVGLMVIEAALIVALLLNFHHQK